MADTDYYCERHDVKEPHYKDTEDPHCIYCREERKIQAQRIHDATRDPMVEPW